MGKICKFSAMSIETGGISITTGQITMGYRQVERAGYALPPCICVLTLLYFSLDCSSVSFHAKVAAISVAAFGGPLVELVALCTNFLQDGNHNFLHLYVTQIL